MKNNVICAKNSGFCFGVKRAVDMVLDVRSKTNKKIYSVGELIHNRIFLKSLEEKNIFCMEKEDLMNFKNIDNSVFVIRAHGIEKDTFEFLKNNNFQFIDATCPYVERIHKIVDDNSNEFCDIIIIGDANHPEVMGTKSHAKGNVFVFANVQQIEKCYNYKIITQKTAVIVAQTTFNHENYVNCQNIIKKVYTNTIIFDTICNVTEKRQSEAFEISSKSDVMIVIGGEQSSNSKNLYEICKRNCGNTFFTQNLQSLPLDEIKSLGRDRKKEDRGFTVGITAGASTPDDIIEEVKIRMLNLIVNSDQTNNNEKPEINEDMSFAEMLDATFHTMRPGERVQGVITSITPTEVHVDLGIKHTGIIPFSEITDDASIKLDEILKVGETVEVIVTKFNDAEGTVALSKKRIDADKNWHNLVDAGENGAIVSGKIVEVVKGGLIMASQGNKIFIPATHTTLPRSETPYEEKDLQVFMGKTLKAKILETNDQRKRAVGSVRLAQREEREANESKFWTTAEVGQKFEGVVKSITQYGAFVDLGGVDGMVHITELSWKRLKHPTDVVSIGDKITVFIKALDAEKKRISLGYRLDEDNPWTVFTTKFNEGDVADVKIVSLMPFGAFAEIVPGIDGLIHISQISDKRIAKPSEVLNIGDIVKVKITAVDMENKKISLSMRALLEPVVTEEVTGPNEEVVYDSEVKDAE